MGFLESTWTWATSQIVNCTCLLQLKCSELGPAVLQARLCFEPTMAMSHGCDVEKDFPPPSAHLSGGCGFKPCDWQKLFGMKFNCSLEGMMSSLKLTFLSYFFQIQLTWFYLDPSFLHFLLPLESLSKLYVVPWIVTNRLSYISVLSHSHKPFVGNFPVWACSVAFKNCNNLYSHLFLFPVKRLHELKQELDLDVHRVPLEDLCKQFNTNLETGLTQDAVLEGHKKYGNN